MVNYTEVLPYGTLSLLAYVQVKITVDELVPVKYQVGPFSQTFMQDTEQNS